MAPRDGDAAKDGVDGESVDLEELERECERVLEMEMVPPPKEPPSQTPKPTLGATKPADVSGNIAQALRGGTGLTPSQLHTAELEAQVEEDLKKLSDDQFQVLCDDLKKHPEFPSYCEGIRMELEEGDDDSEKWEWGEQEPYLDVVGLLVWAKAKQNMSIALGLIPPPKVDMPSPVVVPVVTTPVNPDPPAPSPALVVPVVATPVNPDPPAPSPVVVPVIATPVNPDPPAPSPPVVTTPVNPDPPAPSPVVVPVVTTPVNPDPPAPSPAVVVPVVATPVNPAPSPLVVPEAVKPALTPLAVAAPVVVATPVNPNPPAPSPVVATPANPIPAPGDLSRTVDSVVADVQKDNRPNSSSHRKEYMAFLRAAKNPIFG